MAEVDQNKTSRVGERGQQEPPRPELRCCECPAKFADETSAAHHSIETNHAYRGGAGVEEPSAPQPDKTSQRADGLAVRLWREFIDDDKLDIKKIRAICYIYLAQERNAAGAVQEVSPAEEIRPALREVLCDLEHAGISWCSDLAEEGDAWEVPAEPEPQYFPTLHDAILFRDKIMQPEPEAEVRELRELPETAIDNFPRCKWTERAKKVLKVLARERHP